MAKIGHISTHYLPILGGQEVYIDNLVNGLPEHSHSVFQLRQAKTPGKNPVAATVHQMKRHRRLPPIVDMALGLTFRRPQLSEMDVLVVNYPEYYRPVAWHPNVVVLSHGATWGDLTGNRREAKRTMSRDAMRHCAAYVFDDTFAMREIGLDVAPGTRYFEWIIDKAMFIPNCVDGNLFHPTAGIANLRRLQCICVPRNLSHGRGVDLAIRALRILVQKGRDLTLAIAGDSNLGDVEYRRGLFDLTNELELTGKVLFLGMVANVRMRDVYSSCLMTLIPTRYREGTSLSALESMACGTPVVATNVEGLLDLPVQHCEPSPEAMADAVQGMLDRRDAAAAEQRKSANERFSMIRWRKAWGSVVEQVWHGKKARPEGADRSEPI